LDPAGYKQQLNDLVNQALEARVASDAEYEVKKKRATPEPDFDIDVQRAMEQSVVTRMLEGLHPVVPGIVAVTTALGVVSQLSSATRSHSGATEPRS
jgi:hypothetical protein